MRKHWWLAPLYWLLAVAPLAAAFWVFRNLPDVIYVTPTVRLPTGRAGVWVLPAVNVVISVLLYVLTEKMGRAVEAKAAEAERKTDILQVLPVIRVFFAALLTGMCFAVVYGHYVLDAGRLTAALLGRVLAFVPGVGMALVGMRLSHATAENILALRWTYTERSQQIWLKTHKLGAGVLYASGAIMVGTAFLLSGLWAAITAGFALFSSLFGLYLYAKHLYENEFR